MRHRVRIDDVNVVNFPPPVTEGQRQWERRLTAQLRRHLPQDQIEMRNVLAVMNGALERRATSQLEWRRLQQAAYVLSMFPDDYRAARRIINRLSCEDGDE